MMDRLKVRFLAIARQDAAKRPRCPICKDRYYLICERSDGTRAIERCDSCSIHLSDLAAAMIARDDGVPLLT